MVGFNQLVSELTRQLAQFDLLVNKMFLFVVESTLDS